MLILTLQDGCNHIHQDHRKKFALLKSSIYKIWTSTPPYYTRESVQNAAFDSLLLNNTLNFR